MTVNIQRTDERIAADNVLKEVRQILGVPEGHSVIEAAQTVMGHAARVGALEARVKELEGLIELIDHQYDAMQQIKSWCKAYPVDMLPPPDWTEVEEKLGSNGLSCVSAANMRHVLDGIRDIINECEKNSTD